MRKPDEKLNRQLRELEAVAAAIGLKVCYEPMTGIAAGTGGLCKIRGEYRLIVDRRLKPRDRIALLVDAIGRFDTSEAELSPEIAGLLEPSPRRSA